VVFGVSEILQSVKPEVQLDRQIRGDMWQRSADSGKGVSKGNKDGGCNITEVEVTKGLA
jgi:hypothetical protein